MPPTTGTRTSTRQGRATVRPTNYYARTFAGRLAASGLEQTPEASSSAPGFLPALTHFTGAVDAFPKEIIKHFSMFKEVEAKLHDPEHLLKELLDEIAQQPVTTKAQAAAAEHYAVGGENSASLPQNPENLSPEEQATIRKRQLFFRLRMLIANMLPTLDEKLVVLQGAKATKDKGLVRMHHSYSQLDGEISDEARYGSLTHWAYADKEEKKKGGQSHERQRREVAAANNLAAAAQHVHDVDSIAAKSEARREAMHANKRNRHQQVDSDFDDRPAKKPQKRKPVPTEAAAAAAADNRGIGLGISSNGAGSNGKRKKTEKALAAAAPAAPPMERSSSALKVASNGARGGSSPQGTPAPESSAAKRKPRAAPAPAQRKNPVPPYSPPMAASPLAANFAINKATAGAADRPLSARARKNSTATSVTSAKDQDTPVGRRPSSSHSVQQVASNSNSNNNNVVAEIEQAGSVARDNTSAKGASTPKEPTDAQPSLETSNMKVEDMGQPEPESMEIDTPAPAPASGRPGRTSKTSTPVVGAFPEIAMSRSRSSRNVNAANSNTSSENNSTTTGTVSKRGQKKNTQQNTNAGNASPAMKPTSQAKSNSTSSAASSVAQEQDYQEAEPEVEAEVESEEDGDEPRYCYCNEVSYGNMIACDNDDCPREWFHLGCVHLEKPPTGRAKWFCSDECKEAHAKAKAKGGRPGSSRQ